MKQASSTAAVASTVTANTNTSEGGSFAIKDSNTNNEIVGLSIPSLSAIAGPSATPGSRWSELLISKSPRIIHIAVGHEGQHAILLSDEGVAYFVGVSRRGEDGETSE